VQASDFGWITTAAQMGMGFILPFALVFVAIPLETFVHSMRTVIGVIGAAFLRAVAFTLRLVGNLFRYMGRVLVNLYDLIIFGPLWLETTITGKASAIKPARPTHSVNADYQEAA
jgi:hypothetical protein